MNAFSRTFLGILVIGSVALRGDEAHEAAGVAKRMLGEAEATVEAMTERYNVATEKALALVTVAFGWKDAGMPVRADAAFKRIAEITAKMPPEYSPGSVWQRMATEHARRGDVDAALQALEKIASPENHTAALRKLIPIFLSERKAAAAVTIAHQLPASEVGGGDPHQSALQGIVKWQAENDDVAGAARTAEFIVSDWVRFPALTSIAVAQARRGETATAAHTLAAIRYSGYLVPALVALGEASAGAGDRAAARAAFAQASKAALTLRDFNGARGSPVLAALGTIARAQRAAGDAESARATVELARTIAPEAEGDTAINETVLAIAEAGVGEFERAMARVNAFRGAKQRWRRAQVCASIAANAAAGGEQEIADRAFARAASEAGGLQPKSTRTRALQTLGRALLKAGRVEAAAQNASKLPPLDRDDLLGEIIAVHARQGNVAEAMALAKSISGNWARRGAKELIAVAQFRGGDFDAALKTAPDDTGKPGSALRQILEAQLAARDGRGALQTFARMRASAGSEPETLVGDVAAIQVEGANWQAAHAWANQQTSPAPRAMAQAGVARGVLAK